MKQSRISQALAIFDDFKIKSEFVTQNYFLFGKDKQYEIDIASDLETRKEAYQLMYKLYRSPEMDYAVEDPSQMWYSLFNFNVHTNTIVVREVQTRKVVATLTVVIDSVLGLPLEENYPEKIREFRNKNRICAEIISLGLDENVKHSNEILVELFKYSVLVSKAVYNASDFLIMIKPRHAVFYIRRLLFEAIGPEINCKKINYKPVMLYHLDLSNVKDQTKIENKSGRNNNGEMYKDFEVALRNEKWMSAVKNTVLDSEMSISEIEYFFMQQKELLSTLEPSMILKIARFYKSKDTKMFLQDISNMRTFEYLNV